MSKIIPLLGPKFLEQTTEGFYAYAKDVAGHLKIKRPETKTRKKKQDAIKKPRKSRKSVDNTGPEPSSSDSGKTQENVENVQAAGWQDKGGNQFLITITD